ncbi:MAG: response regulator [Candidatus Latescibacterota bacterium]|nr:response regulator [Candidatus Latescibacterota bacterium]
MGKLNVDMGKILATQGGKNEILVIDDSSIARKTVAQNLKYYGFDVMEADSGIGGLKTYLSKQRQIALVILSLTLSDVPGVAILAKLREKDPDAKVVVITESTSTEFKQADEGEVAGVLRKPISTDRLLKVIHLALAEG